MNRCEKVRPLVKQLAADKVEFVRINVVEKTVTHAWSGGVKVTCYREFKHLNRTPKLLALYQAIGYRLVMNAHRKNYVLVKGASDERTV